MMIEILRSMFQVSNKFEKAVGYNTVLGIKFMKLTNTWNPEQKITTVLTPWLSFYPLRMLRADCIPLHP